MRKKGVVLLEAVTRCAQRLLRGKAIWFQSDTHLGISSCAFFYFSFAFSFTFPLGATVSRQSCRQKQSLRNKKTKKSPMLLNALETDAMLTYPILLMSQGAALFCVESADPCRLRKQQEPGLGWKGWKCQDYRDQRSNRSPAVREESQEGWRRWSRRRRKPWWRELQKSALIYTAYGTLRWERRARDDRLFSHLTPVAWEALVWVCICVCECVCVMVSSSLPGAMALCFTARAAATTSTTRAVTCRR